MPAPSGQIPPPWAWRENEAPATWTACSPSQALGQGRTWNYWLAVGGAGQLADRLVGEDVKAEAVAAGC
jgi:hypothetical protein